MILTLRIKKVYFDAIADGRKNVEYRAVKPFYDRIFKRKGWLQLVLHYQKAPRLRCEILSIRKRRASPKIAAFLDSKKVYAIRLGKRVGWVHGETSD